MTAEHDEHCATCTEWPPSITVRQARLSGTPVAECSDCEFVSVSWDCPCDLAHECDTDPGHTDLWVCRDCYTEYHYGMETERTDDRSLFDEFESEQLSDNVCSNHNGTDSERCEYCRQTGHENGIREFSMNRCEGCYSTLGGDRHRLAYWPGR